MITSIDIKVTRQELAEPSDESATKPDLQQLPIQDLNDGLTRGAAKNLGK